MSCKHGNWEPCELCDELDQQWDQGFRAGKRNTEKLIALLRECDAAIVMLDVSYPAQKLLAEIKAALAANAELSRDEPAG